MKVLLAIVCTLFGCCANIVILELMVKADPGSGNLVTFAQFAFIAAEGFISTAKFGTKPLKVHVKYYVLLVSMFFLSSVLNNSSFNFNIPMPLHMIFRSGSLIGNMTMGYLLLKKRYDLLKIVSVLMITVGVIICTIVSGSYVKRKSHDLEMNTGAGYSMFFWWIVGIGLLTLSLFVTSAMGLYQEFLCKKYGKHPREGLYVAHLLPLPGFLLLYNNIAEHMAIASASEPVEIPFIGISLPILWIYLIGNCLTQYLCISSVFLLTTECTSLAVSVVLGTALVFLGTIMFTEALPFTKRRNNSTDAASINKNIKRHH